MVPEAKLKVTPCFVTCQTPPISLSSLLDSLFDKYNLQTYRGGLAYAAVFHSTNESIVHVCLHVLFATKSIHVMLC